MGTSSSIWHCSSTLPLVMTEWTGTSSSISTTAVTHCLQWWSRAPAVPPASCTVLPPVVASSNGTSSIVFCTALPLVVASCNGSSSLSFTAAHYCLQWQAFGIGKFSSVLHCSSALPPGVAICTIMSSSVSQCSSALASVVATTATSSVPHTAAPHYL